MRDIQCRSHVCRTCLSRLAKPPPPPPARPWIAPFSSYVFNKKKQPPRLESSSPSSDRDLMRKQSRAELMRRLNRVKIEKEFANDTTRANAESFSVRYFEQDGQKRKELADEQAFGDSFGGLDASEIGGDLSAFQSRLKSADEKDAFNTVLAGVGERWDGMKTAEDLERMIAKMQIYTQSIDREIEETGADLPKEILAELLGDISELPLVEKGSMSSSFIPQIPKEPFNVNQSKKISHLNKAIVHTSWQYRQKKGLMKRGVQMVWGAYHLARPTLSRHWSCVPLDVWDHLWKVLSTEDSGNVHRLEHIAMLAFDMSEAKVTLTPPQQLLAIEAVFVSGWEDKALSNWRRCMNTIGAETSEAFQEFWGLGARMFCRVGDMEQAERAINKLLDRHMDPRILLTLIRTCCEQDMAQGQEKAWASYRRMRELLGKEMKLTDYDQVVAYFLTANQVENGLYAFVDMMSDGRLDLKDQKQLPSVIANKFFFGKWLKRLIGAGNLDGAYKVIEFMEREKIGGASIQVNGLVGAWLRSGGHEDVQKADALAWRMIETKIQYVQDRNASLAAGRSSLRPPVAGLPRATLETFYLLAENYRQRGLHAKLEALWDAFRDAELKADAFMMNQLLESHMAKGQWKDAVSLYHYLVEEQGVVPDPYSFSALWKTLAINRLHIMPDEQLRTAAEATRSMFKETVKFKDAFAPDGGMDGQLARKILHSFRRLKDQAGFLVALLALRDIFHYLPSETLVMELLLDTTKLAWDTPSQRRKLMLAKRNMERDLRSWAGGDDEKLQGEHRGEALYHLLQKKYWSEFDVQQEEQKKKILIEMAKEMGVYQLLLAPKKDAEISLPEEK